MAATWASSLVQAAISGVQPGGLLAVRADPAAAAASVRARCSATAAGARVSGSAGDVVLGEQLRERGGGVVELLLQRGGRVLELAAAWPRGSPPSAAAQPLSVAHAAARSCPAPVAIGGAPSATSLSLAALELRPGALLVGRERGAGLARRRRARSGGPSPRAGPGDARRRRRRWRRAGASGSSSLGASAMTSARLVEPGLRRRRGRDSRPPRRPWPLPGARSGPGAAPSSRCRASPGPR